MRVGVLGINHKLADLRLREALSKACQKKFFPGIWTHIEHQFVLLSTCNRTEIYFASENLASAHTYLLSVLRSEVAEDFDQKLYSFFGPDCLHHLNRVTAGLDSALIAETEIQGQVKAAYEKASELNLLSHDLHYLFQNALKIGKKIRNRLPVKPGLPDLENALFAIGKQFYPEILQKKVLFVGASEINKKMIRFFKQKQMNSLTICNRTLSKAYEFASHYQMGLLDWSDFILWNNYDIIILGTKSPEYLISEANYLPSHEKRLVIDLSVPRNVDPILSQDHLHLLNIDQINISLKQRNDQIQEMLQDAEEMAIDETWKHMQRFSMKERQKELFLSVTA